MPSTWDKDGKLVDGNFVVIDRILRIEDVAGDGTAKTNGKISIDGVTEQSIEVNGKTLYLQNVGDNKIYMDSKAGVNADKWEIMPRGRLGPITAKDKLYFLGAGVSTLKYLFVG